MLDFTKLKTIINNNNSFLITSHVNPDADAIGSELGLYYILKKLGKEAYIINHNSTPDTIEFLDRENVVRQYDPELHDKLIKSCDVLVMLDLNQILRVKSLEKYFKETVQTVVCIDHHEDPEDFTENMFLETSYASTGEMIYDLVNQTKIVDLDFQIAEPLYAAIMTDTGSFRYERTTPKTHMAAAELLKQGVDPKYVFMSLYDNNRIEKLKLMGSAIASMQQYAAGRITYITITQKMLDETGALESDVEGFVNFCLSVKDVKIGLLFYELKDGIKISFRSKVDIPINKLAAEFGGGGHYHAAGARIYNVSLDEYIEKVLNAALKYL
ncbi:MAG: bifunctional oligoribonuclease/PAP phosphatase NrnA [Ignavibacteria bacterium]|jgi:phosphoesterase RecJ-like protein